MDQYDMPGLELSEGAPTRQTAYDQTLGQWMTPSWAAEAIAAHALPGLASGSVVVEPTCGIGRFLDALPAHVRAIGVEVDPALADEARKTTGRVVVTGDFRTVTLPVDACDALIGNPPFDMALFDGLLARAHRLLGQGGPFVVILPASAFQTPSRVVRYNADWSLSQEMLPRTLFPGLRLPLVLARFVKDARPRLAGMLLYHECAEIERIPAVYRRALADGRSGWKAVVDLALSRLGGSGTVAQVCAEVAPRRPTATRHWRAKIRQQLALHHVRTARGTYIAGAHTG